MASGNFDYGLEHVLVDYPAEHVVRLTLNRPDRMNATNDVLHTELTRLPALIDADPAARAGIITGAGKAFCVGGDYSDIASAGNDYANKVRMMRETVQILTAMTDMRKPVVSAINGAAAGIGLAVALLADISVANENANFSDGHTRIGLVAGDHGALIWPLLCSMAQAKRYLLTADKLSGREAERIGLVSEAVSPAQVMPRAIEFATTLASRSPLAIEFTKRSLNHWIRAALPAFESSLGYELVTAFDPAQADHLPKA